MIDLRTAWLRYDDEDKINDLELEGLIGLVRTALEYARMRGRLYELFTKDIERDLSELEDEKERRQNKKLWTL